MKMTFLTFVQKNIGNFQALKTNIKLHVNN